MKRVLVLLANGVEEMELVAPVDVLRRAGVEVVLAGVDGPGPVVGRSGIHLLPDTSLGAARGPFDLVLLPGGCFCSETLATTPAVHRLLREQEERGGRIAATCLAPVVLVAAGVVQGRALTCHPSVREQVAGHGRYRSQPVVCDGTLITSRGADASLEFALTLVGELRGPEVAAAVAEPLLIDPTTLLAAS
jgi:protein DJ-1